MDWGVGEYQKEIGHHYYSIDALAKGMKMYNETLVKICLKNKIECIDLAKQLEKKTSIFWDDMHFTEHGAQMVAKILTDYLAQDL